MKTKLSHQCVFSDAEIELIRSLPATMKVISGKVTLIIMLFVAVLGALFIPLTISLSQASDIGKLLAVTAERHTATLEYRKRSREQIKILESKLEKAGKKVWWAESHAKDAKTAIEKFLLKLESQKK